MIVVTVGTNEARFDRLLAALAAPGNEELVVQHGPSPIRPPGARCVDYLLYDDLVDLFRRARAVVSHAGVGSVMTALANGKQPIVVPRLARFGEAVDDHQLAFAERLDEAGLVRLVRDPSDLAGVLADATTASATYRPSRALVGELRDYLDRRGCLPGREAKRPGSGEPAG